MASSKPILCGPCDKSNVNTNANSWCYNCAEGLCATCLSHHEKSTRTHSHKTIEIRSYKPSIQAIKTECDKHYQQLNLYCPFHLMPCCDDCISTNHSKCTGIKSLASVVEKTNIEKSMKSVETDISSILYFLNKLVNTKSKNIKTGEHTYLGIQQSVKKIRKEINKHLDYLENKLCQETDTIWNQEKSKATDFISEIERKSEDLKVIKENVHTITEHSTSKLQSFLGVHQIEEQVHQYQRYVDNLEDDEKAKEVDIKMKQNHEIETILSKLESIKSLGEVMVVKKEIDLKRETGVKKEAQIESREQSIINNMAMHIETKIETNLNLKFIDDMICLMDGTVILMGEDSRMNLFTADGKFKKHLPTAGKGWGVTQIDQDIIAISFPFQKVIKILNMKKEKVTEVITLDKICSGLSFYDYSLAVGLDNDEICIIDLDNNTQKSIQVQNESSLMYLVYHDGRYIYSDLPRKVVTCIDELGNQIWQYKQDLSGPMGLCTDAYGNVIVADERSNRIIIISKDGQVGKVLISEDKLEHPSFICLKYNEPGGYICDFSGTYFAKFDLSYK